MTDINPQPPARFPELDTQYWLNRGYAVTWAGNGWVTLRRPKRFSVALFIFTLWVPYLIYYALKRDDVVTISAEGVRKNGKQVQAPITPGVKAVSLILVVVVTLLLTALTGSTLVLLFGVFVFIVGAVSKTKKRESKVVRAK